MRPDDLRHGTPAGHHAGCRNSCCVEARNTYERNRRKRVEVGHVYSVPAVGSQRRIRALMALGWPGNIIAERAGIKRGQSGISALLQAHTVRVATAARIARAYDDLSMRLGPSPVTRARAQRNGWLPPLAWDDERIDDPVHSPTESVHFTNEFNRREIDEVVVLRVLAGEHLPTTRAEREEILRRWLANGGSQRTICNRMGWKQGRYAQAAVEPTRGVVGKPGNDEISAQRKAS